MSQRKTTTPQAVPQSAEIISFAGLQRQRAIRNAEGSAVIYLTREGIKAGDVLLWEVGGQYLVAPCSDFFQDEAGDARAAFTLPRSSGVAPDSDVRFLGRIVGVDSVQSEA